MIVTCEDLTLIMLNRCVKQLMTQRPGITRSRNYMVRPIFTTIILEMPRVLILMMILILTDLEGGHGRYQNFCSDLLVEND